MIKFKNLIGFGLLIFLFASCELDLIEEPETLKTTVELKSKQDNENKLNEFDDWGFNYNAQIFKGYLINAMFGDPAFSTFPHYKTMIYKGEGMEFWDEVISNFNYFNQIMPAGLLDCKLSMKWNSALLPKDAIYPDTWVDTDAWIAFKYKMITDTEQWTQVRTLIASKSTDYLDNGLWYNRDGKEIGKESYYWPTLIIIHVVNTGDNPYVPTAMPDDYISPFGAGMGKYK